MQHDHSCDPSTTHKHHHPGSTSSSSSSLSSGPAWIYPSLAETQRVIEWDHVSLEFEGRPVITDVTTWIHRGELTCLCGANGAGKTQLVRLALGLVTSKSGKVSLLGGEPKLTRSRVGYVPQMKTFSRSYPATVEDVLVAALRGSWPLWTRKRERDLAAQALERVGGLLLLDKDITVLSGGELQRAFMARALIGNPEILVLDEPMAAIDTKGRGAMFDLLAGLRQSHTITIVLITHSDDIVSQLSDRVVFLERGRLVGWGTPAEVMTIDALRDVAFFGHDHEAVIGCREG